MGYWLGVVGKTDRESETGGDKIDGISAIGWCLLFHSVFRLRALRAEFRIHHKGHQVQENPLSPKHSRSSAKPAVKDAFPLWRFLRLLAVISPSSNLRSAVKSVVKNPSPLRVNSWLKIRTSPVWPSTFDLRRIRPRFALRLDHDLSRRGFPRN